MTRALLFALASFSLVASPQASLAEHPSCQPPDELRAELANLDPDLSSCSLGEPCRADRRARLTELLDAHGFQVHLARLLATLEGRDGIADRETLAERATATAEALGHDLDAWYLAGSVTRGEAGEALLMDRVLAQDPDHPWANLAIVTRHYRSDKERAADALERFLTHCPSQLREAESIPQRVADGGRWAPLLETLESATAALPPAERVATLPKLWSMQFAARPLDRHDALRQTISEQVAAIRQLDLQDNEVWWNALEEGYELSGDEAGATALDQLRMTRFPCHDDTVAARFEAMILDVAPDTNTMRIKAKAVEFTDDQLPTMLAAVDALRRECPDQRSVTDWWFRLVQQHEDAEADEVVEAANAYLASEKNRPGMRLDMPEYKVARLFVDRHVALHRVPGLIRAARANRPDLSTLRMPDSMREHMEQSQERALVQMARIAAAAHHGLGQSDEARREASDARALYTALDAEVHGANLATLHDALTPVLAELELPAIPAPATPVEPDELAGTPWTDVEEPLPAMALLDLDGRTWTLADFADQGVLINFWATWCVPCVAELPEIQALHEELADVEGLTVVTFNVDRNLGKVKPFMDQRQFDFPVVLATDFLPPDSSGIPQNWLVDRQSVVRKKSSGFNVRREGKWRHDALGQLRAVVGDDGG